MKAVGDRGGPGALVPARWVEQVRGADPSPEETRRPKAIGAPLSRPRTEQLSRPRTE